MLLAAALAVGMTPARAAPTGLELHGFADVGYVQTTEDTASGAHSGFVLGNLDFYLTPQFGSRVKSLAELTFEYDEEGSLNTDLERLQIGYIVDDRLTLWLGRFHTPYGYWNTAYHHGAQIQPSIERPRFLAFEDEGGILPAHTAGLWAAGRTHVGSGQVTYDAYVGNGSRIEEGVIEPDLTGDSNNDRAIGARFGYQFSGAADGLWVGVHGLREEIDARTAGQLLARSEVSVLGAFAAYTPDRWELFGEYYRFSNDDLDGGSGTHGSWAGFLQVGYSFNGRVTPYARGEKASLDQQDPYFAHLEYGRSYTSAVIGVRYDVEPTATLKFEGGRIDATRDGGERYNEARLQLAVRF
jgi:hypothetical protein